MSENSIFMVGDEVYHVLHGRGIIIDIETSSIPLRIDFGTHYYWAVCGSVSFDPWPAPNHVRPMKNGVYKVEYGGEHWVMCFRENVWYFVDSSYTTMIGKEVGFPDDVKSPEFLYSLKYHA